VLNDVVGVPCKRVVHATIVAETGRAVQAWTGVGSLAVAVDEAP
jgi:hypothetical protein